MTTQQMEYFLSLAQKLNFSAVAERFFISQPTLSRQISNMERELNAIVDQGWTVLDVVVEHPVYGQITGRLDLSSRYEVSEFIRRVNQSRSHPLSDLTDGIHLHTVSCPDEGAWRRVLAALEREGFLLS